MPTNTTEQIADLTDQVLLGADFFLVDINIAGGKQPRVSVFIDGSERNVNLDECAEISNELGFLIDAHEIFDDSYRINVSSPGLERPLTDWRQYPKNKGRKVSVTFNNEEEQKETEGILKQVDDDKIIIKKQGEHLILPFDKIVETKVIPSFK